MSYSSININELEIPEKYKPLDIGDLKKLAREFKSTPKYILIYLSKSESEVRVKNSKRLKIHLEAFKLVKQKNGKEI
jgi:uncharacterized protein YlxW (UPF0749 family)